MNEEYLRRDAAVIAVEVDCKNDCSMIVNVVVKSPYENRVKTHCHGCFSVFHNPYLIYFITPFSDYILQKELFCSVIL